MESFAVICETCGARLRVRDTAIIGEIHGCPKCESMVQILPPAGWQAVSTETSVVQAVSSEPAVADSPSPTIEYVDAAAPAEPVAAAALPAIFWWGGGAVILIIGLAVGMWAGSRRAANEATPAVVVAEKQAAQAEADEATISDPYAVNSADDDAIVPAPVEPESTSVEAADASIAAEQQAEPELPELPNDEPVQSSASADPDSADQDGVRRPASSAASERRQTGILRFDPLDFDPSRLSLTAGATAAPRQSSGSIEGDSAEEIDVEAESSLDKAAEEIALPSGDETWHVRLGPMPTPASRPDYAELLAVRVDAIEVADVPLVRFVDLISDMAGVPITVDPAALEFAGVAPLAPVSAKGEGAAFESLLQGALSPQRLEVTEREGQYRVVLRRSERQREVDYEIKDLAAASDASGIAALIERFVAPSSWQAAGGQGTVAIDGTTLRIEQSQGVHHAILIFCERLRLARGLAPRSRYPAERLSIESAYRPIDAQMGKQTTFTFLPWTRLRDVVSYWQETSGLTILVDWAALASVELEPSSPIACSVRDRTWEEALDGILEPLGLAWWAVDGGTIQITTVEAVGRVERVEFYNVPDSMREQFASGKSAVKTLDEASGRLIVRAPAGLHRSLAEQLASLAK